MIKFVPHDPPGKDNDEKDPSKEENKRKWQEKMQKQKRDVIDVEGSSVQTVKKTIYEKEFIRKEKDKKRIEKQQYEQLRGVEKWRT